MIIMVKLTKKEKMFTVDNAQQLFKARQQKNSGKKVYDVLNNHAKMSLKLQKEYVYNTKKEGKLSIKYIESDRTIFDEKAFAKKHPSIYKRFMTTKTVTIANIKKI